MRDYILVYINGHEHKISGADVFLPITDYLRDSIALCGTKVVCSEGDCGACTVMLGRLVEDELEYKPVNACILYGYQVDSCHVVTVEGLRKNGVLNPVQKAMVECHGAQCGYCTPGFIVAMTALFEDKKQVSQTEIKDGLVGNLCRCTGYESIIKAGSEVDAKAIVSVRELYDEAHMVKRFKEHMQAGAKVSHDNMTAIVPASLDQLIASYGEHPGARLVSGGTDLSVQLNKGMIEIETMISTANVRALDYLTGSEKDGREVVEVGARVPLSELEAYLLNRDPGLDYLFWVFGSPQIRNSGTLVGNIANASPIADTLPFLFVMDAQVLVAGLSGKREIGINQFYKGYKSLALDKGELITGVRFSLPVKEEILKLYKISAREHLDISAFTAAIRLVREGDKIKSAHVAYGGVAAVVLRMTAVEEYLVGKAFELKTFEEAGRIARDVIEPLSDVRGSRPYRLQLAENIMSKFYYESAGQEELACL